MPPRDETRAAAHLRRAASASENYAAAARAGGRSTRRAAAWSCRRASSAPSGRGSSRTCGRRARGWLSWFVSPAPPRRSRARPSSCSSAPRSWPARAARADAGSARRGHGSGARTGARADPARRPRRASRSIADGAGRARERRRRARRSTSRASARAPSSWWRPTGSIGRPPMRPATRHRELLDELERVLVDIAASPDQVIVAASSRTCGTASSRATCCSRFAWCRPKFVSGRRQAHPAASGPAL